MRIETLGDADGARWDAYVGTRALTITDTFGWRRVVRDAYGIAAHFLVAVEGSSTVGALGLFEFSHPAFGHYLSTAPFGTDGGFFFDDDAARDALTAEARALATRLRVSHVVIRTRDAAIPGFAVDDHYRTAVVDLADNSEAAFARVPSKTRNQVRRGQKEGFTVTIGADQVPAFHAVFHEHMRMLGTPAHGLSYYETIARTLGDAAQFIVVRDGARIVAGALLCFANGTANNIHTVALPEFNPRCPNYLLYWRMFEEAIARKCARFDMGRSEDGSTQLAFKENWGPRIVPLFYNYFMPGGGPIPRMDPHSLKFTVASAVWRMMPLALTKAIGPRLISGIA